MRLLKLILFYSISTCFILLLLEAILRLFGEGVYHSQPYNITSYPKPALIGHHRLGFALSPGHFDITLNHKLQFSANHTPDSNRVTKLASKTSKAKEIWIYGCSFTYGWGLDDTASFPFKVQKALPQFNILNKGVPGHGTVQHLMRLGRELRTAKRKPRLVVLCYGSFHDDRSVLSHQQRRFYKRAMFSDKTNRDFTHIRLPFIALSDPQTINFESIANLYAPWSVSRKSALMNFVETKWLGMKDRYSDMEMASLHLISEMNDIAEDAGIEFLVAGILQNEKTEEMLGMLTDEQIDNLDISVNTLDPSYTLAPYDDHPNSKATQGYKNTLVEFVRKNYIATAKQ